ncbi:hypothetical protein DN069_23465 [Streptacidiphilus pinicola]|uniref:Gram-positive cocci surface proteins LPxTG domain-containing protein n=1 Tax=Streptacidiphilus pinicola TaxID=2219663 RepID=A0A2X0IFB0_9ACTN|nr:hypothetical protein DN069_23465 [Streptacidiphilus pinicola]
MLRRSAVKAVAGLMVAAGATGMGLAVPAAAAVGSDYGHWSLSGGGGSITFPVRGFPDASFTTTSASPSTPSGASTYLNDATPFGAEFGSSKNHDYLLMRTARGGAPSVTTVTFDTPAPAGHWGFALGDIDADRVRIHAVDENGAEVSAADLGWQDSFNYCDSTPRPGSCTRGPFTDKPVWHEGRSTLVGHVVDTDGAAGWFKPTVALRSITFEFSVQSGIPVGQIWMAAHPGPEPSPSPTLSPSSSTPTSQAPPEKVDLPSGSTTAVIPVPPINGLPVTHVQVLKQPAHGTVHVHDGMLVYHAEPGCPPRGADRLTYSAHNRKGQTATRKARIVYKACEPPTLAETGADAHTVVPLALGAAGLLTAGGALVLVSRRRSRASRGEHS